MNGNENHIGVSCRCGTIGCCGEVCNATEFQLATAKRSVVDLEALWTEFLLQCTEDSGVPTTKNFLGSVEWYKIRFDKAIQHLKGK